MDPTVERVVPVDSHLRGPATADAVADARCAHRVVGVVPEPSTVGGRSVRRSIRSLSRSAPLLAA